MSRKALRFMTLYFIVGCIAAVILTTCSSCKTVHKAIEKTSSSTDSIITATSVTAAVKKTDSTSTSFRQNDYSRVTVKLKNGGQIQLVNNADTASQAYTGIKDFVFPEGSIIIFEKGTTQEAQSSRKKNYDSTATVTNQKSEVHKQSESTKKITDKKINIPWYWITVLILLICLAVYLERKISA